VAWFDVKFSSGHKPITFSTGPKAEYTHWKQTVFYIDKQIAIHESEVLNGTIAVRKSIKNKRELDIKIGYNFDAKYPYIGY